MTRRSEFSSLPRIPVIDILVIAALAVVLLAITIAVLMAIQRLLGRDLLGARV